MCVSVCVRTHAKLITTAGIPVMFAVCLCSLVALFFHGMPLPDVMPTKLGELLTAGLY